MQYEFIRHKLAYLLLSLFLLGFTLAFFASWPNHHLQRWLIIGLIVGYSLWGSLAHVKASHLTKRVFFEYLAMSLLGGSMLFLITL